MRRLLIVIGLLCMILSGCGGDAGKVHVRIRNNSNQDWKNFWLGAGGPNNHLEEYGAIASGETTDYIALEPMLAKYRKFDLLTDGGTRYNAVVYPENHLGDKELAPGNYTFAFDIVNNDAVLTLTKDQ